VGLLPVCGGGEGYVQAQWYEAIDKPTLCVQQLAELSMCAVNSLFPDSFCSQSLYAFRPLHWLSVSQTYTGQKLGIRCQQSWSPWGHGLDLWVPQGQRVVSLALVLASGVNCLALALGKNFPVVVFGLESKSLNSLVILWKWWPGLNLSVGTCLLIHPCNFYFNPPLAMGVKSLTLHVMALIQRLNIRRISTGYKLVIILTVK